MTRNIKHLRNPYDELSTRSVNIINRLGGEKGVVEHFELHGGFLDLRNSGIKVNNELTEYAQYLAHKLLEKAIYSSNDTIVNGKPYNSESLTALIRLYNIRKKSLSVRAINVLLELEDNYFNTDFEEKTWFYFTSYIINDFDFQSLKKVGAKCAIELQQFRNGLIFSFLQVTNGNANLENILVLDELETLFGYPISQEDLTIFNNANQFNLFRIMCVLVDRSTSTYKSDLIRQLFYFSEETLSPEKIMVKTGCTNEYVRTQLLRFNCDFIQTYLNKIPESMCNSNFEVSNKDDTLILELSRIDYFKFNNRLYTPNKEFARQVYSAFFDKTLVSLDDLLAQNVSPNLSFIPPSKIIFIKIRALEEYNIIALLNFVNREMYNFEMVGFEYKIDSLIRRFYIENHSTPVKEVFESLIQLIILIKRVDWQINEKLVKSIERKEIKSNILIMAEELLKDAGKPLRTAHILSEITKAGNDVTRSQLLILLNRRSTSIVRFGNGFWGLKDWDKTGIVRGALRDIVRDILASRDKPVHLSELLEIISERREISTHSLVSNLRACDKKSFVFFNCGYFGLTDKKYPAYWHRIPRFRSSIISKYRITPESVNEKLLDVIQSKHGFPPEHILFILSGKAKNIYSKKP